MLVLDFWNKRDEYIKKYIVENLEREGISTRKEYLINNLENDKKLAELIKKSIEEGEKQLTVEYPREWSGWSEMKGFCIPKPTYFQRLLRMFGKKINPRPANIEKVVNVAFKDFMERDPFYALIDPFEGKNKDENLKNFTLEEFMLLRQCFALHNLGINPKLVLI